MLSPGQAVRSTETDSGPPGRGEGSLKLPFVRQREKNKGPALWSVLRTGNPRCDVAAVFTCADQRRHGV